MSDSVEQHYQNPNLIQSIRDAFREAGKSVQQITLEDLAGIDEFHIGGRKATEMILGQLPIANDDLVLDIGCGLGGAARYVADRFGCRVHGFDITKDFVHTGNELSAWVELQDRVKLVASDGESIPLQNFRYDYAYMFHVGMNIQAKESFFKKISHLMNPGSHLIIFDLFRYSDQSINYPVPWADDESIDFSCDVEKYESSLNGFQWNLLRKIDHSKFAIQFFEQMMENQSNNQANERATLSLKKVIRRNFQEKMRNVFRAIKAKAIQPVELVFKRD